MPAHLSKLQQELITALTPASPGEFCYISEHGNAVYVVRDGRQFCILTGVKTATRLSLKDRGLIVAIKHDTTNGAGQPRTIRVYILRPTDIPATYIVDPSAAFHVARIELEGRNGYSSNPFQPRILYGEPSVSRVRDLDDAFAEAQVEDILNTLRVTDLKALTYEDAYKAFSRLQKLARRVG